MRLEAWDFGLLAVLALATFFRFYHLGQTPPGLNADEAVDGMDAQEILRGWLPVYAPGNYGRETLFIYLLAAAIGVMGPTALALRTAAALVGIATVYVTFLIARRWFGRWVGLLSAAGVATSFWHVDLSRVALRGISAPLLIGLAIYFLWNALSGGRRRDFVLAGVFAALSQYTYISARFLGPLILVILALEFARRPRAVWALRRELALYVAVGLLVFAPLGVYYLRHWDTVFLRSAQVSIFNPHPEVEFQVQTPPEAVLRTLGMFFVRGDEAWRHNLSGRPVFTPPEALLFLLGLAFAVRNGQCTVDSGRGASLTRSSTPSAVHCALRPMHWLLAWLVVEMLPGMLAHEAPNFLRETAIVPPTYMLPALGLVCTARWTARRWRPALAIGLALSPLLVLGQALATYRAYFDDWALRPETYRFFDGPGTDAVRFLDRLDGGRGAYPSVLFWFDRSAPIWFLAPRYRPAEWIREYTSVLPLPRDRGRDAVYLCAYSALPAALLRYFPDAEVLERHDGPAGQPAYVAYRVPRERIEAALAPEHSLMASMGGEVELLGYTLQPPAGGSWRPGGAVDVTLLWRMQMDNQNNYGVFIHLDDAAGRRWGQRDLQGFIAEEGWRRGDLVLSRHTIPLPGDAPAIGYRLLAGVDHRTVKGQPSRSLGQVGAPVEIATVSLAPAAAPASAPRQTVDRELAPGLRLLGYTLDAERLRAGERMPLELLWRASDLLPEIEIEVRLRDAAGQVRWQAGPRPPAYGQFPTSRWLPGESMLDPYQLAPDAGSPSGPQQLLVRVWQRGVPGEEVVLGLIEVHGRERSFAAPRPRQALSATFDGQIELLGYDLDASRVTAGRSLRLTLYWKALRQPDQNYTVFTHLLDGASRILGQRDSQPQAGASPTGSWQAGEVVKDDYEIPVTGAGEGSRAQLEVGLYDATTGRRLPVTRQGQPEGDRLILASLPAG